MGCEVRGRARHDCPRKAIPLTADAFLPRPHVDSTVDALPPQSTVPPFPHTLFLSSPDICSLLSPSARIITRSNHDFSKSSDEKAEHGPARGSTEEPSSDNHA